MRELSSKSKKKRIKEEILENINDKPVFLKIVVAGERNIGRGAFINRYLTNRFNVYSTEEMKDIIYEGIKYRLALWCLRNPYKYFRDIYIKYFYKGAQGIFLMFDLTNTLPSDEWLKFLREINPDCPILLVGTKLDLHEKIVVLDDDALAFREKHKLIDYIKVSAKTGENIEKAFGILLGAIIKRESKKEDT